MWRRNLTFRAKSPYCSFALLSLALSLATVLWCRRIADRRAPYHLPESGFRRGVVSGGRGLSAWIQRCNTQHAYCLCYSVSITGAIGLYTASWLFGRDDSLTFSLSLCSIHALNPVGYTYTWLHSWYHWLLKRVHGYFFNSCIFSEKINVYDFKFSSTSQNHGDHGWLKWWDCSG